MRNFLVLTLIVIFLLTGCTGSIGFSKNLDSTLTQTSTLTVEPTKTATEEPTKTETVEPTKTATVEPSSTPTPEPTATSTPVLPPSCFDLQEKVIAEFTEKDPKHRTLDLAYAESKVIGNHYNLLMLEPRVVIYNGLIIGLKTIQVDNNTLGLCIFLKDPQKRIMPLIIGVERQKKIFMFSDISEFLDVNSDVTKENIYEAINPYIGKKVSVSTVWFWKELPIGTGMQNGGIGADVFKTK
jgi:hypothetical protein